jgi:hypothetical protein
MVSNGRKPSWISKPAKEEAKSCPLVGWLSADQRISSRQRGTSCSISALEKRQRCWSLHHSSDAKRKASAYTSMQVGIVDGVEAVEIDPQSQQLWQRQQHLGLLPGLLRVEDDGGLP